MFNTYITLKLLQGFPNSKEKQKYVSLFIYVVIRYLYIVDKVLQSWYFN